MKALDNKAFKDNWQESLRLARGIFRYKFQDGDPKQKIILSLAWFTNVSPTKHTVLKIKDGEYGKYRKEIIKKAEKQVKVLTEEDRMEMVKTFNEVFGRRDPVKVITPKQKPDDSTSKIVKSIAKSIGIESNGEGAEDDGFDLV